MKSRIDNITGFTADRYALEKVKGLSGLSSSSDDDKVVIATPEFVESRRVFADKLYKRLEREEREAEQADSDSSDSARSFGAEWSPHTAAVAEEEEVAEKTSTSDSCGSMPGLEDVPGSDLPRDEEVRRMFQTMKDETKETDRKYRALEADRD